MKNLVLIYSILTFTILYGTSCQRENAHTTSLTVENLDGRWKAKGNDYDISDLYFNSDLGLTIIEQYYSGPIDYSYIYYLDTTSNIYIRPNNVSDTFPYFVCPIKFVNADRIRIGNLPACLGEEGNQDITFVRD